ncbi:MAG: chromosome segregation protein SMC [Planctomycetota bacterium]
MKIKKLILHGFKSFADRTEFSFDDGINVIVGPNGCGKSNVVDAIKWVLGEQRPTSLRGKDMQDVIFSGTDRRKGVGFAEVSLVFDNTDATLDIDYEEVAISRRLYRSGESEYLINGNPVRLRDVRELMMDSGGGSRSMAVMEQGNIDQLLRADPVERRAVFEEAAGIAKYRARRKETQRKLERTQENLERLRDLLGEFETRERSLKIQAGKARRFTEFTEELRTLRVQSALARYAVLAKQRDTISETLAQVDDAEKDARRHLEEAVAETAGHREQQSEFRESVALGEAEMARLLGEQRASTEKRNAREREAEQLELRAQEAESEGAEASRRAHDLTPELETAQDEEAKAEEVRGERARGLEAADALLREVEARAEVLRREIEALSLSRTEAFAVETEARNAEVNSDAELRALQSRGARLDQRATDVAESLRQLQVACAEAELELKSSEDTLRALEERSAAAEQAAREARDEKDRAAGDAADLAGEAAGLEARRELLQRLVEEGEGLGGGTRALLEAADAGGIAGVRGVLADILGDVGEQAALLDSALGDLAGAVVVETTEHARAAIAWLKEHRRGRARLIPLDRLRDDAPPLDPVFDDLAIATETRPLLASLLATTRIADSLDDALEIALAEGRRAIARTGEEAAANGALAGGAGAGGGLVSRNTELSQIQRRLAETSEARADASGRAEQARGKAVEWERTLSALRPTIKQTASETRVAAEKVAAAKRAVASRNEERELEDAERSEVARLIEEHGADLEVARERRSKAESQRDVLENEAKGLQDRTSTAELARHDAVTRQTDARVEAARWSEKAGAAAQRCRVLTESIGAAEREAEVRRVEAERCRARGTECKNEVEALERLEAERAGSVDTLAKQIEQRRQSAAEMEARLKASGDHLDQLRDLHEKRREQLEQQRLKENEYRLRIETLLEQVKRDHGVDWDEEQLAAQEVEGDPEQLDQRIEDLRSKLERLGNVNHAALEELESVDEKLTFMRREESDLNTADKQLRDAIEKIDETCTTRFQKTFDEVRENFKVVFRKLFGGGKAELRLQDPEDVLGSGIEIAVRPPGKELRNMALLSGGEKSLTTVALLFSIYQTKAPPFCLLDEVDAALDESNTVRLCEMLKDFAVSGQFVVITHARPTMTVANTLYGVTMPEAGVSRRVSVKFADIEAGRVVGLN